MITGSVVTLDAGTGVHVPVVGARVTIPKRCQFGAAWTESDGTFRFPINGGERWTLRIEADADGDGVDDYLPVERSVETHWRATAGIETVELILPMPIAGTLDLSAGAVPADTVINGPLSEDDRDGDGLTAPRTPSLLFEAGTVLTALDADGAPVALPVADVRITEYTVGRHGSRRMPAPMPPGTGYGYAVELSVDGAEQVYFDRPVIFYLDNFLGTEGAQSGFPTGLHEVGCPSPPGTTIEGRGGSLAPRRRRHHPAPGGAGR